MFSRREFLTQAGILGSVAALPLTRTAWGQDSAAASAVSAEMKKEYFNVQMPHVLRPKVAPRTMSIPDVDGFKVLKGDFHIHTVFSDGKAWPTDRIDEAKDNGLDVIAITDHIEYQPYPHIKENPNFNLSYEIASKAAESQDIILVRGTEITRRDLPPGHFNALFIKDVNPIAAQKSDWRKMFEEVASQGGFLLWNHPGWVAPKSGGLEKGQSMEFTDTHEEIRKNGWMHGVEAFNHAEHYPIVSDWVEDKDLAIFTNSDIHMTEWNMYGHQNPLRPVNLILAKERTLDSIKEAFFAKRIIGWVAGMVLGREKWLAPLFRACVEMKTSADRISFTNKSSIPCKLRIGDAAGDLAPLGKLELKKEADDTPIQVENWFVRMNKTLLIR